VQSEKRALRSWGLITAPIFILPHFDERAIAKRNINVKI
jgi:hypothetical protein